MDSCNESIVFLKVCFFVLWLFIELHYVGFGNELIKYELMDSLQRYAVFSASDFCNFWGMENMICRNVTDQYVGETLGINKTVY